MPSRIDICNRALARIGAQTLQSEGAPGAEQVLLAYDSVLEVILAMKPWKFTMWTAALTRATNEQAAGWWTYQYQLPADRVGVPRTVYDRVGGQPFTDYELSRTHLLTNAETIWMRYQRDPAGLVWPPLVTECVVLSLAGDLAVVLRDNLGLRSQFKAEVFGDPTKPGDGGLIQRAATQDAQAGPSPVLQNDGGPLIYSRFS
jgi:hypothetical protein